MKIARILFGFASLSSTSAFAAAGSPVIVDYYQIVLKTLGVDKMWVPTLGALFILSLLVVIGFRFRSALAADGNDIVPSGKFSLRFLIEGILSFVLGIAKDNCGSQYRSYFGFLAALFLFILLSNLTGLIPGFPPPTLSMDTNLAMGLFVFIVYNFAGVKEHGFSYIKHFAGPVIFIAPLFFCIELVSHASRPLSLSLRLVGNLYADHTLLGIFTGLSYIVFPALLVFFGLLVAIVQSFVFTLLSAIYISMAISHDH
jgi:F-type H+-transporting ATPase subunit a